VRQDEQGAGITSRRIVRRQLGLVQFQGLQVEVSLGDVLLERYHKTKRG